LPASFAVTFFPAISALELHKNKTNRLYTRSLKYMLLIMGPMILLLIIFAGDVLGLWLGREWALKTTLVFQILAIGIFLNALAQIPANLLDGIGRPDLRTKTLLFYMPVYIGMLWLLVAQFGIVGAALAWTLRAVLELLLFFGVVWKVMDLKRATFIDNGLSRGVMIYCGVAAAALLIFVIFTKTLLIQSIVSVLCLILFGLMAWRYVLDDADKQILFSTVSVVKK
jgi:O-antigen/teichoic acid export membrane protein